MIVNENLPAAELRGRWLPHCSHQLASLPVLSPRGRASVDWEGFERAIRPSSLFSREDT